MVRLKILYRQKNQHDVKKGEALDEFTDEWPNNKLMFLIMNASIIAYYW